MADRRDSSPWGHPTRVGRIRRWLSRLRDAPVRGVSAEARDSSVLRLRAESADSPGMRTHQPERWPGDARSVGERELSELEREGLMRARAAHLVWAALVTFLAPMVVGVILLLLAPPAGSPERDGAIRNASLLCTLLVVVSGWLSSGWLRAWIDIGRDMQSGSSGGIRGHHSKRSRCAGSSRDPLALSASTFGSAAGAGPRIDRETRGVGPGQGRAWDRRVARARCRGFAAASATLGAGARRARSRSREMRSARPDQPRTLCARVALPFGPHDPDPHPCHTR